MPPVATNNDLPDARAAALSHWQLDHPASAIDARHLAEAAKVATLLETDGVPWFEPLAFEDLAQFLADMPF